MFRHMEEKKQAFVEKIPQKKFPKAISLSFPRARLQSFYQEIWSSSGPDLNHKFSNDKPWNSWADLLPAKKELFSLFSFFSAKNQVPDLIKMARQLLPQDTKIDELDDKKIKNLIRVLNNKLFLSTPYYFKTTYSQHSESLSIFYHYYHDAIKSCLIISPLDQDKEQTFKEVEEVLKDFHQEIWHSEKILYKDLQKFFSYSSKAQKAREAIPDLVKKAREILPEQVDFMALSKVQMALLMKKIHQDLLSLSPVSMERAILLGLPALNDFYERYQERFRNVIRLLPSEVVDEPKKEEGITMGRKCN